MTNKQFSDIQIETLTDESGKCDNSKGKQKEDIKQVSKDDHDSLFQKKDEKKFLIFYHSIHRCTTVLEMIEKLKTLVSQRKTSPIWVDVLNPSVDDMEQIEHVFHL